MATELKNRPHQADPPEAKKIPFEIEMHSDSRIDNYYWLRERENPEVISYLEAENEYLKAMMAHTDDLQDKLFTEIKERIKENDESVPYRLSFPVGDPVLPVLLMMAE